MGVLVTDLSVGAPPTAEAPPCVFQVPREAIYGVDLEGTWCQAGEEDRDEATLLRSLNRQDQLFILVHSKPELHPVFSETLRISTKQPHLDQLHNNQENDLEHLKKHTLLGQH